MDHYNWQEISQDNLSDLISRQVIHTGHATIARLLMKKGAVVPAHHHVNEQVSMVASGALAFEMAGDRFVLRAGDVLVIPPDVPHRVEALEESVVTDLFTPPRADWIGGDDGYLRGKSR